jgi:hypothetical protein
MAHFAIHDKLEKFSAPALYLDVGARQAQGHKKLTSIP